MRVCGEALGVDPSFESKTLEVIVAVRPAAELPAGRCSEVNLANTYFPSTQNLLRTRLQFFVVFGIIVRETVAMVANPASFLGGLVMKEHPQAPQLIPILLDLEANARCSVIET